MRYTLMAKAGRCWNGAERDSGTVVHAVPDQDGGGGQFYPAEYGHGPAVCGATPGRRSAGWSKYIPASVTAPTCTRCAKKIANTQKTVAA